jgi:hypothetical protein
MLLSILMPALVSRRELREPLESRLRAQLRQFRDTELLIEEDAGALTSGVKRNRLIARSQGRYFAFVDDDDDIADNYVSAIREACLQNPHCVTFRVLHTDARPGKRTRIFDFSIANTADHMKLPGNIVGFMANHLSAWRRDIGTRLCFPPRLGYNDDVFWYKPLLASGFVQSEIHLTDRLYRYNYHPCVTANQAAGRKEAARAWAGNGIEYFMRDEQIFMSQLPVRIVGKRQEVPVWNCRGEDDVVFRDRARRFFVCRVL